MQPPDPRPPDAQRPDGQGADGDGPDGERPRRHGPERGGADGGRSGGGGLASRGGTEGLGHGREDARSRQGCKRFLPRGGEKGWCVRVAAGEL